MRWGWREQDEGKEGEEKGRENRISKWVLWVLVHSGILFIFSIYCLLSDLEFPLWSQHQDHTPVHGSVFRLLLHTVSTIRTFCLCALCAFCLRSHCNRTGCVCSKYEHRWICISLDGGVTRPHTLVYSHRQPVGNCPTYIFEWLYFCIKYEVVRNIGLSFS